MKKMILLSGLIMLMAMPGLSYAIGLEAALGVWSQGIEGEGAYNEIVSTDVVDFKDDLKLEDETRLTGRVKIDMPVVIPNVYVMVTPMEFEGVGKKKVDLNFGDFTFEANGKLKTTLTMDNVDLCLFYSIPFLNLASLKLLNIDLGLNLKVADLGVRVQGLVTDNITGLTISRTEEESYTLPIPMLYAGVQVKPIDRLALEAEFRGIALQGDHLFSAIGRLKVNVLGPLFIAGGYRYDDINLNEEDLMVDCTVSGYFVETGFTF